MGERRLFGLVEVDSGTFVIGDPGGFLPWADRGRLGVDYPEVITATDPVGRLARTPALLIQSFGGDGTFAVFGEYDEGELVRIIVELDGDPD